MQHPRNHVPRKLPVKNVCETVFTMLKNVLLGLTLTANALGANTDYRQNAGCLK